MKFVVSADWHIRSTRPHYRTDDFSLVQYGKVQWVLEKAKQEGAKLIVPGDMFDGPDIGLEDLFNYMELFWKYQDLLPIYTVYGQHDLRHRTRSLTPLTFLDKLGIVKIVPPDGLVLDDLVVMYGWSYDEPRPVAKDRSVFNVMVAHVMVCDGPLWPGHSGYMSAGSVMRASDGWDLWLTGDNHKFILTDTKHRTLINTGSLMRLKIDQMQYVPQVVMFDTESCKHQVFEVPQEPPAEVFATHIYMRHKEIEDTVRTFVEVMNSPDMTIEIDDIDNMADRFMHQLEVPTQIRDWVTKIIAEAKDAD
jgi:DNA repair exonuclease SbcCD nuclease subunit